MSGIPTKSDERLRNNFDAPELAATTLPSRSTRSNGSGNLQMIREKSRCVIFAHTYLLMSQTCQTASRIPLLCRFLLAWLRLHDDPANPSCLAIVTCAVPPQTLRRHSWASCIVESVRRPGRYLLILTVDTNKKWNRQCVDNFLSVSYTHLTLPTSDLV